MECVRRSFSGGKKDEGFIYPRGVAISSDGNILVTDDHRLQKISFSGTCIKAVCTTKKKRRVNWPIGIAQHPVTGQVYVTDSDDNEILVFDPDDLTYLHTVTLRDSVTLKKPRFAAFDNEGFLYIADSGNHCVTKLTVEGECIKRFGSRGKVPGQYRFH